VLPRPVIAPEGYGADSYEGLRTDVFGTASVVFVGFSETRGHHTGTGAFSGASAPSFSCAIYYEGGRDGFRCGWSPSGQPEKRSVPCSET
jgi:hypothetical protein